MSVVTIAITTMMEKREGPMRPFCKPILRMINSISPLEFISVPTANAVRLSSPLRRAAAQQATPLPTMDAASTTKATPKRLH